MFFTYPVKVGEGLYCAPVGGFSPEIPEGCIGVNALAANMRGMPLETAKIRFDSHNKPYFLGDRYELIGVVPPSREYSLSVNRHDPFSMTLNGELVFPLDFGRQAKHGEIVTINSLLTQQEELKALGKIISDFLQKP